MIFEETFTLNNGVKIPKLALGTWKIPDTEVASPVATALKMGYRHLDTAQAYHNERGVGQGIKDSGISRDQIFVNSKVEAEIKDYQKAKKSIDETLARMDLDYLDMMIIHNPQPWNEVNQSDDRHFEGNLETWRALEDAMREGKLRAIGVSSFQPEDLQNLIDNSDVKPMVNQILCHIGATPKKLIDFCQEHDIVVESFSPVAHGEALTNTTIKSMAKKYHVSVAQLCIRYDWQLNTVVLPKSVNPKHMKQNAELNFEISDVDMANLEEINSFNYGSSSHFPVFGGKR
ncbi:aldo/keto reductase [Lactobacillus sp. M0398]|uniref:aldo/keto reductase n=1 Tax=Lactobacillus TaxID=1578 RepID=UPI0018DC7355|nr:MULTISPECIES: aldo/keto reductase [unclassified Lactobacillus]MBI0121740.1 aldo/keto reductase [Lactobacillus sp. M0398]MBI0122165.1 aldo/keto reductase [Lactobacillus sp. W8174]MBI0134771.1 aldo/keto reductase [Lactobacillus sp. W8173]